MKIILSYLFLSLAMLMPVGDKSPLLDDYLGGGNDIRSLTVVGLERETYEFDRSVVCRIVGNEIRVDTNNVVYPNRDMCDRVQYYPSRNKSCTINRRYDENTKRFHYMSREENFFMRNVVIFHSEKYMALRTLIVNDSLEFKVHIMRRISNDDYNEFCTEQKKEWANIQWEDFYLIICFIINKIFLPEKCSFFRKNATNNIVGEMCLSNNCKKSII